jgi:hypothetical protein
MARVPLLVVPFALLLIAAAPAKKGKPAGAHPDVGPDIAPDACETCHAEATPAVHREWRDGPHGLNLVLCFVCHGSTGKDFVRVAAPARCEGCHPAEVASVVPAKGKGAAKAGARGCFECHAPHALSAEGKENPHGARAAR